MIMTGAMVKAEEAYLIGLVSQVTEDDQTIPTAIQMAQSLAKCRRLPCNKLKKLR